MFEYIGAIHMHSIFSDGTGRADEIAGYANELGLDYIILTDHNTMRAFDEGYEKYYGNTLLMVGCEINDKENLNHYLAMRINKPISTRLPALEYVKKVKKAGGIGFIAHPHEKRNTFEDHPPYPWKAWESKDFTGMEIWNHMSEWVEGLTEENKFNYFIHPLKTIEKPNSETLEKWDELNLERKVIGIGGVDAHAHKVNFMGILDFEIFPYKVLFKAIRTHILLEQKLSKGSAQKDIENDKKLIYSALEQGRVFFANNYLHPAEGFRFLAEEGNLKYNMGDSVPASKGKKVKLKVILPKIEAEIRLIHNGKLVDSTINREAEFFIQKTGVYRVEVFYDNRAWIFSNHIRIGM